MIFTVDFGEAQTGVGYRFIQQSGAYTGPRQTDQTEVWAPGVYKIDTTPPSSAVAIYWDCDDPELTAREDITEIKRLESYLRRPPVPAFVSGGNEFYNLSKAGFREALALVGIPISFGSYEHLCITSEFKEQLPWQAAGF